MQKQSRQNNEICAFDKQARWLCPWMLVLTDRSRRGEQILKAHFFPVSYCHFGQGLSEALQSGSSRGLLLLFISWASWDEVDAQSQERCGLAAADQ